MSVEVMTQIVKEPKDSKLDEDEDLSLTLSNHQIDSNSIPSSSETLQDSCPPISSTSSFFLALQFPPRPSLPLVPFISTHTLLERWVTLWQSWHTPVTHSSLCSTTPWVKTLVKSLILYSKYAILLRSQETTTPCTNWIK